MLALYVAAVFVSFTIGALAGLLVGAVLFHDSGYQRGYQAATSDRTSRAIVRARLADLAVQATRPLPHAQRDHQAAWVPHLVQLGRRHRR